jgi:hypothetical protein
MPSWRSRTNASRQAVRVAGHEIAGGGQERNVASVRAHRALHGVRFAIAFDAQPS